MIWSKKVIVWLTEWMTVWQTDGLNDLSMLYYLLQTQLAVWCQMFRIYELRQKGKCWGRIRCVFYWLCKLLWTRMTNITSYRTLVGVHNILELKWITEVFLVTLPMAKQAIFAMFIEISFFLSFFFQLLEKRRQMCADEIKGKLVCHWKIYYLLGIYIYLVRVWTNSSSYFFKKS